MAIINNNTVSVKRSFNAPAASIFEALAQGVLLGTCGAKPGSFRMDLREGGAWHVEFKNGHVIDGKVLKVEKNKLLVFTWGDDGFVTISLNELKGFTQMHLLHENISTAEMAKDINWGWTDGVNDFTHKITRSITVEREISAPLAKVYELCAGPQFFLRVGAIPATGAADFRVGGKYYFACTGCGEKHEGDGGDFVEGEFTNIEPNKQVVFTWNTSTQFGPTGETLVSMHFKAVGEGKTLITLIHSGFPSAETAKNHEEGWTDIFNTLQKEHK